MTSQNTTVYQPVLTSTIAAPRTFDKAAVAVEKLSRNVMAEHGACSPLTYFLFTGSDERSTWHELDPPRTRRHREQLVQELVPELIRADAASQAVLCAPTSVLAHTRSGAPIAVDGVALMGVDAGGSSLAAFVPGGRDAPTSISNGPMAASRLRYGAGPAAMRDAVGFFERWTQPEAGTCTASRPALLSFHFDLRDFIAASLTLMMIEADARLLPPDEADTCEAELTATCLAESGANEAKFRAALSQYGREVELPGERARHALRLQYAEPRHDEGAGEPAAEKEKPVGRNEPCPCGSGRKSKKCCYA